MQRYLIAMFCCSIWLTALSCSTASQNSPRNEEVGKKPKVLLSPDKMKEILQDVHLMEAHENIVALKDQDSLGNSYRKDAFLKIVAKHEVDETVFTENLEYYQYHKRNELLHIYERIEQDLGRMQEEYSDL